MHNLTRLVLTSIVCTACANPQVHAHAPNTTARLPNVSPSSPVIIHGFNNGLAGVRARNPAIELRVGRDTAFHDEPLLFVDYPQPGPDPAGRDVELTAETTDWTVGNAISFRVRPAHAIRLSVSFFDRNRVVYTAWNNLQASEWQTVRIAFDTVRPNPYFQPADAKLGTTIDVSDVGRIAFAPQDSTAGSLALGPIVVVK